MKTTIFDNQWGHGIDTPEHQLVIKDGVALIELLESIEQLPRGNTRLDFIAQYKHNEDLLRFFQKALSPDVTFGVKKVDSIYQGRCVGPLETFATDLFNVAEKLESRQWTGNKALQEIEEFLNNCSPLEEKWARRFFRQDLRLDIGAKAFNKAVGYNAVPLFGVPLAEDWAKLKKKPTEGRWTIQPKLDGARTVAYIDFESGEVELYSRTGKRWKNFRTIKVALQVFADTVKSKLGFTNRWVFDGEVLSYTTDGKIDFQALQHTMMRKDGEETGELSYVIFGCCPVQNWFAGSYDYESHLNYLGQLDIGAGSTLQAITSLYGTDFKYKVELDGLELTLEKANEEAVSLGFEGVMLRRLDAPVELKRTKNLIKFKQFQDSEALINGFVEGTGKLTGTLGALVCTKSSPKPGDGVQQRFEIGTGFTDQQRKELWDNRESIRGRWVSYKYQELTKDGIPRFPVYRGLRSEEDFDKD